MRTVNQLIEDLQNLVKKYPEWGNLPIGYASDDEGNSYHKIHNEVSPAQFHDIDDRNLELVGFLNEDNLNGDILDEDGEEDICYKDVNCIIIN